MEMFEGMEMESSAVDPEQDSTGPRLNLLIVDGDPAAGGAFQRALRRYHDAVVISKGQEALERLCAGEHYDVILCDLHKLRAEGLIFQEKVRAVSPRHARRMVFLTGESPEEATRAFLTSVPNPRLQKPVDLQSLLVAIYEGSQAEEEPLAKVITLPASGR
jgi:CheY-like chemotaxis protein